MWVMCSDCGDLFEVDDSLAEDSDPEEDFICISCGLTIYDEYLEAMENMEGLSYG